MTSCTNGCGSAAYTTQTPNLPALTSGECKLIPDYDAGCDQCSGKMSVDKGQCIGVCRDSGNGRIRDIYTSLVDNNTDYPPDGAEKNPPTYVKRSLCASLVPAPVVDGSNVTNAVDPITGQITYTVTPTDNTDTDSVVVTQGDAGSLAVGDVTTNGVTLQAGQDYILLDSGETWAFPIAVAAEPPFTAQGQGVGGNLPEVALDTLGLPETGETDFGAPTCVSITNSSSRDGIYTFDLSGADLQVGRTGAPNVPSAIPNAASMASRYIVSVDGVMSQSQNSTSVSAKLIDEGYPVDSVSQSAHISGPIAAGQTIEICYQRTVSTVGFPVAEQSKVTVAGVSGKYSHTVVA